MISINIEFEQPCESLNEINSLNKINFLSKIIESVTSLQSDYLIRVYHFFKQFELALALLKLQLQLVTWY